MSRGFANPSSFHNPLKIRRAFGDVRTSKRVHARYPCRVPVIVLSEARARLGEATLANIGMGGALLETRLELARGTRYLLWIGGPKGLLLPAKVARVSAAGTGITFLLSAAQEGRLKSALEKLRQASSKEPIRDEKMKWYWWL